MNQHAARQLDAVVKQSYSALRQRHVSDYRRLFDRVTLSLRPTWLRHTLPMSGSRISPPRPILHSLPSISNTDGTCSSAASRPGTQPANLQGIWNCQVQPPWSTNWTANINIQMNYWPAETCNLSDCVEPLLAFIADLSHTGARAGAQKPTACPAGHRITTLISGDPQIRWAWVSERRRGPIGA